MVFIEFLPSPLRRRTVKKDQRPNQPTQTTAGARRDPYVGIHYASAPVVNREHEVKRLMVGFLDTYRQTICRPRVPCRNRNVEGEHFVLSGGRGGAVLLYIILTRAYWRTGFFYRKINGHTNTQRKTRALSLAHLIYGTLLSTFFPYYTIMYCPYRLMSL